MNTTRIAYFATTALLALGTLPGAVMDLIQPDVAVQMAAKMAIPLHLLTLIGIWKLLGVVGILQTRSERVREWAYAGFFFDFTGAIWLHSFPGDYVDAVPAAAFLLLLVINYILWARVRRAETLQAPSPALSTATA